MARETVIQSSLFVKGAQNPNTTPTKFAVLTGTNNLFGFRTGTELLSDLNITASNITDFSEAVDDRVASLLVAGSNITLTYNDGANTLTINTTGHPTGSGGTNRVTYWDTATNLTSNANFIFDGSNLIVGTTTAAASTRLTTRGSGTTNTTFGYTHQNSSGTSIFSVADDGTTTIGSSGYVIDASTIFRNSGVIVSSNSLNVLNVGNNSTTSGGVSGYTTNFTRSLSQNTAVGTDFGIINISASLIQSNGASGISRAIYINPSLSSIVDFRALEIAPNNANAWGIYQSGASTRNYFAGNVSIGTTSTGNALRVSGTPRFDLGSDATGDIFYRDSSGNFVRLPIGSPTQVLTVSGGNLPSWASAAAGTVTSVAVTDTADIDLSITQASPAPSISGVLTTTTVTANSYGSASQVATFTVDSKGRLTAAGNTSIQITESQITDGTLLARVGGTETISGTWSFNNNITIPLTPTQSTHAASKGYVDSLVTGLDWKNSVRAASTANVTVTYNATGGTSARGQITSAPNTLDGVTLAANDRILLKNQSTGAQNGIWVVTTLGTGANGVWDRATDFDQDAEVTSGSAVFVTEGTSNGDSGWVLTTNDPITIGGASGTAIDFAQFSGAGQINAGAGLTKTGNTIDVVGTAGRIVANVDSIDLATTTVTANSYGSASSVATFTVDAYGRLTAAASTSISIASTAVSDFAEAVDDRVDTLIAVGSGLTKNYNDAGNTLTLGIDTAVVATTTNTLTMSNKTLTSPTINTPLLTVNDNQFTIQDDVDNTKKAVFQASGISTGTTRTYTFPNASGTLALTSDLAAYQPLDATLTSLAAFNTNGILTQTSSDTFVGRTITGSTSINVANGNGVSGNPTLSVIDNTNTQKIEVTKNSGAIVGTRKQLNFIEGSNITLTIADDGANDQIDITVAATSSSAYSVIEEEGVGLTQRTILNFVGSGITASDGGSKTNVTLDADLNALAALTTTGFAARTASNTWALRSLTQPAAGLTISNSDGVSGNPTFALANDLSALESLSSTGFAVRTSSDTWQQRTIVGASSTAGPGFSISVTSGDGVSGNPQISLDSTSFSFKQFVRVATTVNLGALSGLLTVDGVTLVSSDRVLVKNQSTASQNGIYSASSGAWTRAQDANNATELQNGQVIYVKEGTTNGESLWVLTTDGTIVVDSTSLDYKRIGKANQAVAGTYGSATQVPVFTLNDDGTISGTPTNTSISIFSTAVSDFAEAVDDRIDTLIAVTSGLTKNYNDAGNTLTLGIDTAVVATTTNTLTMSNKTLTSPTINTPLLTVNDNQFTIQDDVDNTKKAIFQANLITTGTTRTYTFPDASGTLALTSDLTTYLSGTGSSGRVPYYNTSNTFNNSANFIFDGSNLIVGTTTAATSTRLTTRGSGTTNATYGYRHQNSSGTVVFSVADDGETIIGNSGITITSSTISRSGTITISSGAVNSTLLIGSGTVSGGISGYTASINRGMTQSGVISSAFGSLEIAPALTQDTGATGISRGIFINPSLTTIVDFRALEIAPNNANAWGIYQSGASTRNYFAGNVSIGTTSTGNALRVSGTPRFDLGSDATGDIFYRDSSGNFVRLPIGSPTQVLTVSGGNLPSWASAATGTVTSVAVTDTADIDLSITQASPAPSISGVLTTTTVTPNSYGSASQVATFTVDSKGRLTAAGNTSIQITESQITDGTLLARVGSNETISGTWTFNNNITIPLTPTQSTHAASKGYVDSLVTGLDWKNSVRAASTANVTVTYNATGGTSARGQITSAPNTLDGVTLAANDRILLKNQSTGAQNGIWVVTTLGTGANGVWDRATDFDQDAEVTSGSAVFVTEGTSNGDSGWVLTTNDPITIGGASGTAIDFAQFSGAGQINAGAGLTKTGNTIDVVGTAGRIVANVDSIDLATTTVTANSYGSASSVATFTVDAYGRLTAAASTSISIASTAISDFAEAVDDRVDTLIAVSSGLTKNYNDGANTLTLGIDTAVVATTTNTLTMSNKTLTSPTINTPLLTVNDNQFTIQDNADTTKKAVFESSTITTGTTRTYTFPDASGTLALTSDLTTYLSGTGSSGRVPYYNTSNTFNNSANFIFDGSNLIVGTTTAATNSRVTFRGSGTTNSTFSLLCQDSTGTQSFNVDDSGSLSVGKANRATISASGITPQQTFTIGNSAFAVQLRNSITSATAILIESTVIGGSITLGNTSYNSNTTSKVAAFFSDTFAPTSTGTNTFTALSISNVINQTGGHTGVTRGIHINPTLTALSDYRGVEITANSSNAWGIYQSGASTRNYFAGNVSIGTTSTGNALRVSGTPRFDLGSDATGDIFYRDSSGNFVRLPIGSPSQVLVVSGSNLPSWGSAGGATVTEVFIEGFSGSTIDLDLNNGTVKDYNGNNVAFTLPTSLSALDVFKNGLKLARSGVTTRDYTLNAGTNEITFTDAITTTDVIIIRKIV